MLAKCVEANQRDWPDHLSFVCAAYRSTKHKATGLSPNQIIPGHEIRTPVDLLYRINHGETDEISPSEYVSSLVNRLRTSYDLVWRNVKTIRPQSKAGSRIESGLSGLLLLSSAIFKSFA